MDRFDDIIVAAAAALPGAIHAERGDLLLVVVEAVQQSPARQEVKYPHFRAAGDQEHGPGGGEHAGLHGVVKRDARYRRAATILPTVPHLDAVVIRASGEQVWIH